MTSKFMFSRVILFFFIFSFNTNGVFGKGFLKNSDLSTKNSNNIKQIEETNFIDKTIIIPTDSSSNVSFETLTANIQAFSQYTGYIPIGHSHGARLFYFFYKSRGTKSDPVVLWLSGGPGGSSVVDLFYTNGPFHIKDDLSLEWNDFGWDKTCHLLYVDQPIGSGFSYSLDDRDIRYYSNETSNDMYEFLQGFFKIYPEFRENDFYIAGQSYAGHIVPLLASRVHKENKAGINARINLKGLTITNGFTNPEYSYASYADLMLANKLISNSSYEMLKKDHERCIDLIQRCQSDDTICKYAQHMWAGHIRHMIRHMDYLNPYDFRKRCLDPGFDFNWKLKDYLSLDDVRRALGIGNKTIVVDNDKVGKAFVNDIMKNYAGVIPLLLEDGIKVLIFDGEYDIICNWLGNLRWMEAMKWSGQRQFLKTKLTSYEINGENVGEFKNVGPLTFLKVLNAGHIVPMDQPYISLQIFKNWMNS